MRAGGAKSAFSLEQYAQAAERIDVADVLSIGLMPPNIITVEVSPYPKTSFLALIRQNMYHLHIYICP